MPLAVGTELSDPLAPIEVKRWIASPPPWLEVHDTASLHLVSGLDDGETAAIALAEALGADMLLIDERDGYRVALQMGLRVTGTLGLLDLAAERGMVNFADAIYALERTTFRRPSALLARFWRNTTSEDNSTAAGLNCIMRAWQLLIYSGIEERYTVKLRK